VKRHREDRPPARELADAMLDQRWLNQGRLRLSELARRSLLGRARCRQHHHLLAACVQTTHGVWVLCPSGLFGDNRWGAWWWDEIADPTAVKVWCACRTWTLDLTDFRHPHLLR
jgi:hypothetical protein